MNRFQRILSIAALTLGASSVFAAPVNAPPSAQKAIAVPKDLAKAKSDQNSLFNNPAAHITTSGTGGHIATLYTKTQVSNSTEYGEVATVQVETTDPFGRFKGGSSANPKAILGNVAYEQVTEGHDLNSRKAADVDMTMTRTKGGSYRSAPTQIQATFRQGNDLGIHLGNVGVSFAGKNSSWNSEFGKTIAVDKAPAGSIQGAPAVDPVERN